MTKRSPRIALFLVVLSGCTVFSTAAYDPALDAGVTELQTKLNGHFDKLQKSAGTPGAAWQHFTGFYDSARADVAALRYYAALQSGNSSTLHSLDLLVQNLDRFEAMHRDGLTGQEIAPARSAVDVQLRMLLALERAKPRRGREGV